MEQVVRSSFKIVSSFTIDERQIPYAGACLFLQNTSPTKTSVISLAESEDGVIWTVVPFSTPTSAGELSLSLLPGCYAAILFKSTRNYLRISLDEANPEGVMATIAGHFANNPEFAESYS